MVKDVYAVKHKNMILVFCTLFNKKSTFIVVRITAVGDTWVGEGWLFLPLLPSWGW